MAKYLVTVQILIPQTASVEIEAASPALAEAEAKQMVLRGEVTDFEECRGPIVDAEQVAAEAWEE